MRSFVEELQMTSAVFSPPVRSLLDIDFYKFTMGQLIHKYFSGTIVTFKLIVRDPVIPIAHKISETELRNCLDHAMGLRFTRTDLAWLRGMDVYGRNMFSEEYLEFLKHFKLPPYHLRYRDGQIELSFTGPWEYDTYWETIAMTTICGLYYRALYREIPAHELEIVIARMKDRMFTKLERLRRHPDATFAIFGLRRRNSFLWEQWVTRLCKAMMGEQFTGTANSWMAFHHDLMPIGTNAHELPMVLTALANTKDERLHAQYRVLELWKDMYGQGLRIFLPDTYGTAQFLSRAPDWVADWRGMRQDSGDPVAEAMLYRNWLEAKGKNPKEKLVIFSDGLDVDPIISLTEHFRGIIGRTFGPGTMWTNDVEGAHSGNPNLRPFSMVCKVVDANGRPCVKLSNNPNKHTGPKEAVERYKAEFGTKGWSLQEVKV